MERRDTIEDSNVGCIVLLRVLLEERLVSLFSSLRISPCSKNVDANSETKGKPLLFYSNNNILHLKHATCFAQLPSNSIVHALDAVFLYTTQSVVLSRKSEMKDLRYWQFFFI